MASREQLAKKIPDLKTAFDIKNGKGVELKAKKIKIHYICSCCGKLYETQRTNFSMSKSPLFAGNNGFVTICRTCMDDYFYQVLENMGGDEDKAIERFCQLFDWYYCKEAAEMIKKCATDGKIPISLYPSRTNIMSRKGTTYLNTLIENKERGDVINNVLEAQKLNIEKEEDVVSEEDVYYFGAGYRPDEYKYLRQQYDEWITKNECKTKAQEELFKSLAIMQVNIRKAQEKNDTKGATDGFKALQDLMGSANLKPVQKEERQNEINDYSLGEWVKYIENEEPIPNQFEDIDGIQKYILVYMLGCLQKNQGMETTYSKLFEEEMSKYTVLKPDNFLETEIDSDGEQ